ncbi:hypothetical protein FOA52_007708 [Chlamydomonas sp. UWO 241]|nr:hypothetical protein FOA52_007708 [Chlamydomonas sp. UWO 241]
MEQFITQQNAARNHNAGGDTRAVLTANHRGPPQPFDAFPARCIQQAGDGGGGSAPLPMHQHQQQQQQQGRGEQQRSGLLGKRSFSEASHHSAAGWGPGSSSSSDAMFPVIHGRAAKRDPYAMYYQTPPGGGDAAGGGGGGGIGRQQQQQQHTHVQPGRQQQAMSAGQQSLQPGGGKRRLSDVHGAGPGPGPHQAPASAAAGGGGGGGHAMQAHPQHAAHSKQQGLSSSGNNGSVGGSGGGAAAGPGSTAPGPGLGDAGLGRRTSTHGAVYTRLTQNVAGLVSRLDPDEADVDMRRRTLSSFTSVITMAFPEYPQLQVQPFGSYVSGLGTKDSDIDLVITGITEPLPGAGFYESYARPGVARILDRAASSLYRAPQLRGCIQKHIVIRSARMPVARFTLHGGLVVDLSVAGPSGPQAAAFLAEQCRKWPALRPLVHTIKAYLKSQQLNDASSGGLSSYGLTYMVIAHLMEESKTGSDACDLGYMLWRFLRRYGASFDPRVSVVAVGMGGVVARSQAMSAGAALGAHYKNEDRIACIDPLTWRDCTEGCYQTELVMHALQMGNRRLSAGVMQHQDRTLGQLAKVDLLESLMQEDVDPTAGAGAWPYQYNPSKRRG